jgi:LCP family protein required for cell wall assembly
MFVEERDGCMKRKKAVIAVLTILLIGLTGAAGYIYRMLDLVQESPLIDPDSGKPISHEPNARKKSLGISDKAPAGSTGVVNILLLGLDKRSKNEPGHSDAIMIASIDKINKNIKLTSLMRDMYVPIPGKKDNRINTAYFMGGPALAIKTINTNFNMNIEDYAVVDFFALENIINKVGGISIDIKKNEIKYINQYIDELNKISRDGIWAAHITNPGMQTLNGRQAVAYTRVRYVGRDDFERTERQRRVMNELYKQGMSLGITKLPDLAATILPGIETSLTKKEIINLAVAVLGFGKKDIEQFRIPVDGSFRDEYVGNMLVLMPDLEENTRLLHEFIYD